MSYCKGTMLCRRYLATGVAVPSRPRRHATRCDAADCTPALVHSDKPLCRYGCRLLTQRVVFTLALTLLQMGLLDRVSGWLSGARRRATVLVLGLDNSGKSSLLRALRPHDSPAAHGDHFASGGVTFEAHEAPGAARLRALWERHFSRADAIIFVVDAADHLRLVVAREELQLALAHPELRARRLPLLVLANKSDAPHALSTAHVAAALGLERVTDKPWHVCSSSAVCAGGAGLADGVSWLARQLREAAEQGH